MKKLILFGAGGYSDNIRDIVKGEYEVSGYLDETRTGSYHGLRIFGKRPEDIPDYEKYSYFITIGDIKPRKRIYEMLEKLNLEIVTIIDKTAYVAESTSIGKGNYIAPNASICSDVVIGNNNYIGTGAVIEHGGRVGNHTRITTNATVNGEVEVEDEVYIGSGAVLIGLFPVGRGAIVGAGAVVLHEVMPDTTVVGVPAHVLRKEK